MSTTLPQLLAALVWIGVSSSAPSGNDTESRPHLIPLRRELHPIVRAGKVVARKTSYSGRIQVGHPRPQGFRVVFDTGSAHLILPSADCASDVCRRKSRYNFSSSQTAQPINLDGSLVRQEDDYDEASIGFCTGQVTGRFVRDQVCLSQAGHPGPCAAAHVVAATEMSASPFELFEFDGILGLGLEGLALSREFSVFPLLAASRQAQHPHFGVFLAKGEAEDSEIAVGGHNGARISGQLVWVPAARPELGYWQVEILAVRVSGRRLDLCRGGPCSGILDTGTSHLGLPASHFAALNEMLTVPAAASTDCLSMAAPLVEIELHSFNITLQPEDYMRPLPLHKRLTRERSESAENFCTPKLSAVSLPAVGANVLVFGEVVLQRYYTVYDWSGPRVGFGLANHTRHLAERPTKDEIVL